MHNIRKLESGLVRRIIGGYLNSEIKMHNCWPVARGAQPA